jgi:gamma-glutamylcyclotransferase (GGCT)/AIG2-like uncharacterized protein YtfP
MIQEVLVAVYGSLRKGMGNHRVLERNDAQLLSTERVKGFKMFSLGAYPFICHGDGEITIEVYSVPITGMVDLDRLEGYPSFYDREMIETSKGKAWVYFIDDRDGRVPVPDGDWVAFYGKRY